MNLFDKLKNKKILLVDDDEWIRDSLTLYFSSEGCHLLALGTAEEGMELLKREDYEIVIIDYRLPGIDGVEFLKRIQASHPDTIKILITAYGSKDIFLAARKIGIQDFIDKPFTAQAIEESLVRAIENREQENLKSHTIRFKRRMTMMEFRRRQNSDRWHWSKGCSNYPTEKDVIISHTIPEYGSLCEECKEKEPLEKDE